MEWANTSFPKWEGHSYLPVGSKKSYGDVCLNQGGSSIQTLNMDHFVYFDQDLGRLIVEGGVELRDILKVVISAGWILPVIPGNSRVTVGGAIANDVHGKNHAHEGQFGNHVLSIELLRSTGDVIACSRTENAQIFYATIGGIGLTGIILRAEIQLRKIPSSLVEVKSDAISTLEEGIFRLESAALQNQFAYLWLNVDRKAKIQSCLHTANSVGEKFGVLKWKKVFNFPIPLPSVALRSLAAFVHRVYGIIYGGFLARSGFLKTKKNLIDFLFPLEAVDEFKSIFGRAGFVQFQCLVPYGEHQKWVERIFDVGRSSSSPCWLSSLKYFGDKASEGMLSFPARGFTLTMNFTFLGTQTLDLLRELENLTLEAKGRCYLAKDVILKPESFEKMYPRWSEFEKQIDPAASSQLWRRVRCKKFFS